MDAAGLREGVWFTYDWAMPDPVSESKAPPPPAAALVEPVVPCAAGAWEAIGGLEVLIERLQGLALYRRGAEASWFSPGIEALLGVSAEAFAADPHLYDSLIHPDDAPRRRERLDRWRQEEGAGALVQRYRVRGPGGTWRWIEDRALAIGSPADVCLLAGTLADVTRAWETEEVARRSEERNSALIAALPDLIFLIDREGRYIDYHAAAGTRLYAPPEEFLGRRVCDVFQGVDVSVHERLRERTFETGQMQMYEYEIGPAEDRRHYEVRMVPCGADRILSIVRDITNRKRAQQAYQEALERQRLILSELDHRLRNNLASLISLIDMTAQEEGRSIHAFAALLRSRVQAMASVHTLLSRTHGSGARLADLVRAIAPPDLIDRIEAAGPQVRLNPRQSVALAMVLQELLFNSMKYGSLCIAEGRVFVAWQLHETEASSEPARLELFWRETGGPRPDRSPRLSAGTSLLTGLVSTELNGRIDLSYPAEGASHRLSIALQPA